MKNIHILPTDKPSRLIKSQDNDFVYLNTNAPNWFENNLKTIKQNIYITSDEEIKRGDLYLTGKNTICRCFKKNTKYVFSIGEGSDIRTNCKKIILTTDQDLIKDGVQPIPDEFLEWFVNNPSCESIEVQTKITKDGVWTDLKGYVELPTIHSIKYKIIIPKEEPKQENCCTPVGQIKRYLNCVGCDRKPKQETLEHTSKFIAFTLQDSESWIQHSIPLDSFEKADNFCQQFRDRKMSYLICKTLKQGYNGK